MTTKCEICGSATADAFLCRNHAGELSATLTDLAHGAVVNGKPTEGLLDNLADVVLKLTCMGGGGGHRKRGDELPAPFIPDSGKMDKEDKPLASLQGWASKLLDNARNSLTTIVRDLCESRGVDVMRAFRVAPADLIGPVPRGWTRAAISPWSPSMPEMAKWLASHVQTIALDESAGQWWIEVDSLKRSIERVIDRPTKIELLGFCITQREGNEVCGTKLRAPEGAIEVQCRTCRTVRRCDTVRAQGQSDAKREPIPWAKVLETNKTQPDGWRVNDRTLRDWRSTGALKPVSVEDDVELFKWNDVEQLRVRGVRRGGRKRTRAGA